jgi:hypothetical protein
VPVAVSIGAGPARTLTVNEKKAGEHNETSLGAFHIEAGATVAIQVSTEGTNGYVIVDAVQLVKK